MCGFLARVPGPMVLSFIDHEPKPCQCKPQIFALFAFLTILLRPTQVGISNFLSDMPCLANP